MKTKNKIDKYLGEVAPDPEGLRHTIHGELMDAMDDLRKSANQIIGLANDLEFWMRKDLYERIDIGKIMRKERELKTQFADIFKAIYSRIKSMKI